MKDEHFDIIFGDRLFKVDNYYSIETCPSATLKALAGDAYIDGDHYSSVADFNINHSRYSLKILNTVPLKNNDIEIMQPIFYSRKELSFCISNGKIIIAPRITIDPDSNAKKYYIQRVKSILVLSSVMNIKTPNHVRGVYESEKDIQQQLIGDLRSIEYANG